jgi:hypothetical protein
MKRGNDSQGTWRTSPRDSPMNWALQPQQHHWRCDGRIDTHDGTADHLRPRGDNLEGIIWMTRVMLTAYGMDMDGWADISSSFSFLFHFALHLVGFCHLYMLYCYYGGLGRVSIIALPVWRWVRGCCFLASSLGFSREENGMGEQRGRGRREVSCHRFLVYTIPDRPVLGSCISPIPCVYFTYSRLLRRLTYHLHISQTTSSCFTRHDCGAPSEASRLTSAQRK